MSAVARFGTLDGVIDLTADQLSGHVDFNINRGFPPRSIRLTVSCSDGMNIFATVVENSITRFGFDFELNAAMVSEGKLNYLCEI